MQTVFSLNNFRKSRLQVIGASQFSFKVGQLWKRWVLFASDLLLLCHLNPDVVEQKPEPMQVVVDGMLMKLLAESPDGGTVMCCANKTLLKLVDSDFKNLYETNMPGVITAASFNPEKYELFLKIDNRTLIFDLKTKKYRETD